MDGDELKTFISGRSGAHPNGTLAKGDGTTYTGCKWGLFCWLQDKLKQDAAAAPRRQLAQGWLCLPRRLFWAGSGRDHDQAADLARTHAPRLLASQLTWSCAHRTRGQTHLFVNGERSSSGSACSNRLTRSCSHTVDTMFTGDLTVLAHRLDSEDADGSCKSQAIARDSTRLLVQWKQGNCFAALSGKPVQLQFTMQVRTRSQAEAKQTEWALIHDTYCAVGRARAPGSILSGWRTLRTATLEDLSLAAGPSSRECGTWTREDACVCECSRSVHVRHSEFTRAEPVSAAPPPPCRPGPAARLPLAPTRESPARRPSLRRALLYATRRSSRPRSPLPDARRPAEPPVHRAPSAPQRQLKNKRM